MITADFYPTFFTDPEASDVQYTDNISNLTQSIDMFHPYVMGYLTSTYIPSQFLLSTYKATVAPGMDDDGIEFEWAMERRQNIPWFFLASRHTTQNNKRIGQLVYQNGEWSDFNNAWTAQTYQNYQLLNSFDISLIKLRTFTFAINYAIWDDTRLASVQVFTTATSIVADTETLIDFLENNGTLSFNVNMSGYSEAIHTVTFSSIDMINGMAHITFTSHHVSTDQDCEIHIRFVISQVHWTVSRIITEGGDLSQNPAVTVAYQYKTKDDQLNVVGAFNSGLSLTANYIMIRKDASRIFDIESGVNVLTVGDTKYVATGLQGKIPGSFVRNAPLYQILQQTTFVAQVVGSTRVVVVPYILTEEIQKILWQCGLRIADDSTPYGFSDDVYVPQYKTDDSPNYDLLNGDFATIGEKLRPWQIGNITDDDFTWDDVPPYNPDPPGPGEENTGTDIRRPTGLGVGGTNGFITQYALTASQMAEIGRLLWLNFTDADYYKNFLFALTTTGSIDISNLMDYFVSLRVYPFPLINVPSWASAGQDMYIGAGVIPLHFSSTIHTINNYADYIDAGSCTVPRYFNDFRDFTHTQILLFLPYCGTVQLNPADVIGGTLYAQYAIDFASGGVNAYVDLQTHDGKYFMIASLSGNIGADIPLTATNAAQIASKIAGDALNFAGTIGGAAAGDLGNRVGGAVSALTGNVVGVAGAAAGLVTQPIQGAASIAQEGMRIATSDGVKIPMLSGGRGFGSFGQPQTAYIQIRRGMYVEGQTAPQGFKHAFGEAYDQPVQVGSCSGYTVFDNIDTSGLSCTDAERAAIVKQMQQGIFI